MDIISAIKSRKSIRAFLPDPVPQAIIREIIGTALRTPSAVNTQPWEITVISGEIKNKIISENIDRLLSGANPKERDSYEGIYRQRRVDLAIDIFRIMDIKREDKEKRRDWLMRGFRYFDAPVAIIISIDKSLAGTFAIFDTGAFTQTLCLAAMHHGLSTCIEAQGVGYPDIVKKHTGISEDKELIIAIALGYPDQSFPANQLISKRESLDDVVTWLGF